MCYSGKCKDEDEQALGWETKIDCAMSVPNPRDVTVIPKGDMSQENFEKFAVALEQHYEEKTVASYFKNSGYDYGWDYDKEHKWHEIIKPGYGLVVQIEMVPLDKIIADMCCVEDIKTDW